MRGERIAVLRGKYRMGGVCVLTACVLLLFGTGCSSEKSQANPDPALASLVGKRVTLHGEYFVEGKMGPYIENSGRSVYLLPHLPFDGEVRWRDSSFEHKMVSVTGTLRFQHFDPPKIDIQGDVPADYFYFDQETSKIQLE